MPPKDKDLRRFINTTTELLQIGKDSEQLQSHSFYLDSIVSVNFNKRLSRYKNSFLTTVLCQCCKANTINMSLQSFLSTVYRQHARPVCKYCKVKYSQSYDVDYLSAKYGDSKAASLRSRKSQNSSRNKQWFIDKYGLEDGQLRYEDFCSKSAITEQSMIDKYGLEKGKAKYAEWKASIGSSVDNLVAKYGEMEGLRRYESWKKNSSTSLATFIRKYGDVKGLLKYEAMCEHLRKIGTIDNSKSTSKKEQIFHENLIAVVDKTIIQHKFITGKYCVDMYMPDSNVIVEYNGSYWHGDDRMLSEKHHITKTLSVADKRVSDEVRSQKILSMGYRLAIVWELDFDNEPDRVLSELLSFIENEQDFYDSRQSTKKLDC